MAAKDMAGCRFDNLAPLMAWIADRRSEKVSLHLNQPMVLLYGKSHFSAKTEASRLLKIVASFPIPPVVERTSGVKDECSTSRTRCSYTLFFSRL